MVKINPAYKEEDLLSRIRSHLANEGVVSMQQIFIKKPPVHIRRRSHSPLTHSYNISLSPKLGQDFTNLVKSVTGKKILKLKAITLGHRDFELRRPIEGMELVICLGSKWDNQFGGYIIYANRDGNAFTLPTIVNTLSIVRRTRGLDRSIKYVNHHANGRITYLIASLA